MSRGQRSAVTSRTGCRRRTGLRWCGSRRHAGRDVARARCRRRADARRSATTSAAAHVHPGQRLVAVSVRMAGRKGAEVAVALAPALPASAGPRKTSGSRSPTVYVPVEPERRGCGASWLRPAKAQRQGRKVPTRAGRLPRLPVHVAAAAWAGGAVGDGLGGDRSGRGCPGDQHYPPPSGWVRPN